MLGGFTSELETIFISIKGQYTDSMLEYREFAAQVENLPHIYDFLADELVKSELHDSLGFDLKIAVEELFTNICKYSSTDQSAGCVSIRITIDTESVQVEMIDDGHPFNPWESDDPNLDLSPEEREIGGLGIFLVKQLMDRVSYRRAENKNISTICKNLPCLNGDKE